MEESRVKLLGSRRGLRRRNGLSVGVVFTMLMAILPIGAAAPAFAAGPGVVAFDMVGSGSQNLTSFTDDPAIPFGSAGDGFNKMARGVTSIPYAVADDSLSIYTGDSLGIIKEGNTDTFFGVTDTVNGDTGATSGTVEATWVFDVSGASDMELSIDMGAMGDFESSDTFTWAYSIDGGASAVAFASTVDEAGSNTYTLEGGASFLLNDPMLMNGTILTNDLATFTTPLTGTGSEMTLTLTANTNGGTEAFAFQNLIINGTAGPGVVAFDMVGSGSQNLTSFTDDPAIPFGSAGDGFNKMARGVTSIPYAVADDSLSIYTGDSLGIIKEGNTDTFFGVTDTVNGDTGATSGTVEATWVFDVSGASDMELSIDMGAMGDFESSDTFTWAYSIDGGASAVAFASTVDEAGSNTYTLEGGASFLLNDPMLMNGTILTNDLATFTTPLTGTGSEMTLTLTANTNGGTEAFAFQNLIINGGGGGGNGGPTFGVCDDPATLISEVQGPGAASPLAGTTVEIEGIVVGDFQQYAGAGSDAPLGGFMVQEEDADADADPATSEGVFVYDPGAIDVSVGDLVRVAGSATEYFGLTEVNNVRNLLICSTDNTMPTPATPVVPTTLGDAPVDWEAIEGMSASIGQPLYVTGLYPHGAFGEVQLSAIGAQNHPNQVAGQGTGAAADVRTLNTNSRVILDDGETESEGSVNSSWNPSTTPYLSTVDGTLRSGDMLDSLSGVIHYSYGEYEVHPVNLADPTYPAGAVSFTRVNARPDAPSLGGTMTVASFNVLNYFTTFGSRGAGDAAEFIRQADKIVAAIIELDADVVGLMEIENNGTAIADLVTRLNSGPGATRIYGYIDTGVVGGDAIAVGFLYDTATVDPVGGYAVLDSSVSPAFLDAKNRPAVAQTFEEVATRNRVTVAVNHLKSKGSSCDGLPNPGDPAYGVAGYTTDPELPDFAGNCNLTRTAAAQVLGQWLDADPTGEGTGYALIIGDLNAYANESPITALEGLGYTDLHELHDGGNSWAVGGHSYVYDGELGSLDYALGNAAVMPVVTGATAWHINADEPFALDYNDYNPAANYSPDQFASSDHDPVIVGLAMPIVPRRIKEVAITELEALVGVGSKKDDQNLGKAITDLERSLDLSRWTSDSTLDANGGANVFERERQAVSRLLKLSPALAAQAQDVVDDIVLADWTLASVAIGIAGDAGEDVSRALGTLDQGDAAAANGDPESAIQRYMQAWQHAVH